MDVGATFCRPRRPDCDACPALTWCRYAAAPPDLAPSANRRSSEPRFETTTRWLRGRILEQLRSAADGVWTTITVPLGTHGPEAIRDALAALARDGLVELDPADRRSARLPLA
jgi:A/G-specific adenine glycosylase